MIIQMNATVCADMDHGDDEQHKIADSDLGRRGVGRPGQGE
jgi:hypothetical protein